MPEEQQSTNDLPEAPQSPSYTPASPQKRIWAWVGVVYMVLLILLFTYQLSHADTLNGIAGLMLIPAIAGAAATGLCTYRLGQSRWGLPGLIVLLLLCASGVVVCLLQGIPGLMANF